MRTRLLFATIFGLVCLPLMLLSPSVEVQQGLALRRALPDAFPGLNSQNQAAEGVGLPGPLLLRAGDGKIFFGKELADALRSAIRAPKAELGEDYIQVVPPGKDHGPVTTLLVDAATDGRSVSLRHPTGKLAASANIGQRSSLFPPLLAILLAFLLQNTLLSLSMGVLAGCFMLVPDGASFLNAFEILFHDILWEHILLDSFHAYILGFVILLSSCIAVLTRMGAIEGMVQALVRYAKTSRSVQAVAYFLGLAIFFDDYANTIVVGNSSGPLFDRLKVSRVKLAYIVDSTAAPMAGIAALSTWVAFQVSTYSPMLPAIGLPAESGYAIFIETIPYRFYCMMALVMVGMVIWSRRDFGPMLQAEARARHGFDDRLEPEQDSWTKVDRAPWTKPRWENGLIPLLTLIGVTAGRIFHLGWQELSPGAIANLQSEGVLVLLREVLANADSARAIFDGSLAALSVAGLIALVRRQLSPADVLNTSVRGSFDLVKDGVLILILAWSIGKVCVDLDTAGYLVAVAQNVVAPAWLPIILFMTACFVAFATGSSWTTMAILQPNVVVLADRLGENSELGSHLMLLMCIGAVLEGAIFGDHCSPISDTTILSSTASRCQHMEHVRTQAPYAIVCAGAALILGYVPSCFFGAPPIVSIGLGITALALVVRSFGKRAEDVVPSTQ